MSLESVHALRAAYQKAKRTLPWLDVSVWPDDEPAFPDFARPVSMDYIPAAVLGQQEVFDGAVKVARYDPQRSGALDDIQGTLEELASRDIPLVVLHTDVDFDQIAKIAQSFPKLPVIIESGPRKILYFLDDVKRLMTSHENVQLSTYNFCNWLGLETLCALGLGERLLYGSHMPRYGEDAAMAPIIMGRLTWQERCDIAGNNLRRLLGQDLVEPDEVPFETPKPFIIDAHCHSVDPGDETVNPLPTPDQHFAPEDWVAFMNLCAIERLLITPMEPLFDSAHASIDYGRALYENLPKRFSYFEVFNPNGDEAHQLRVRESMADPSCVGIKIHPVTHRVAADDDRYEAVYQIADETGKPIMTHSWEVSSYNPHQYLSHPDRFRRWLVAFPEVPLILGHAGGRPSAFEALAKVCADFSQVSVDLSGDYYDNGLIDVLAANIGPEKIIFGSDMNWIDPRCNLGPVLGSPLSDQDVLKILRENALERYLS